MARRTRARALLVASVCAVLLSMAPAMAGAGMERLHGAMGAWSPASRTVSIAAPSDGRGQAGSATQGRGMVLFLSGMILGMLLGFLLGFFVPRRWHSRQRKQRDIDRLTEEFQALFRKIDQGE